MVFYNSSNKNAFLYFYISCYLGLVSFWFLFDRSACRIVCLLACLIGQLLYLALFDCSLFACLIGCFLCFYCLFTSLPLGCHCFSVLPLLSHVLPAVYIHVSACVCSYSAPPFLSLPSVCRSVCLPVYLSVRLPVCLSVRFCLPPPPPPLSLSLSLSSSPSFSTPSPLPLCPLLFFVLFWFGFVLFFCGCLVLFSLLSFFHWILNTSHARFKRM